MQSQSEATLSRATFQLNRYQDQGSSKDAVWVVVSLPVQKTQCQKESIGPSFLLIRLGFAKESDQLLLQITLSLEAIDDHSTLAVADDVFNAAASAMSSSHAVENELMLLRRGTS